MAAPAAVVTPQILTDPGYLFWAPIGTAEPTHTVVGSIFTDAWSASWLPLGATADGSEFTYSIKVEPINVAEFFDPIKYSTTERSGSIAFSLASYTAANLKYVMNGAATTVTGVTTTTMTVLEPPDPGSEVRAMIGWESLDHTVRLIARKVINGSEVKMAFKKAPDLAVLPVEFQFEVPTGAKPFTIVTAGAARA